MVLKRVKQEHRFGCFIAAFACARGIQYKTARKRIFPKQVAAKKKFCHGLPPGSDAVALMKRLGLRCKASHDRDIRKMKAPALLFIDWRDQPHGHCVIWDPKRRKVLDPAYAKPLPMYEYQSQLAIVIYFSRRKAKKTNPPNAKLRKHP